MGGILYCVPPHPESWGGTCPPVSAAHVTPPTLSIEDQYAFRTTGSTTAALVHLYAITHMLTTNPYVIVLCLDFSKAFDILQYWRSSLNLTCQIMYTTGWSTSSMATHTALNTKGRPHHCTKSQLASYKDPA